MSKEKVDAYKESKANRKEKYASEQKKRKRNKAIAWIITIVAVGALAAALIVTGVNIVKDYINGKPVYDAKEYVLDDYMNVNTSNNINVEDLISGGGNVTIGENGETIISGGDEASQEEETPEENAEEEPAK